MFDEEAGQQPYLAKEEGTITSIVFFARIQNMDIKFVQNPDVEVNDDSVPAPENIPWA